MHLITLKDAHCTIAIGSENLDRNQMTRRFRLVIFVSITGSQTICEKSDRTDLVTIFHPSFGILGMGVRKLISLFLYCVV